jgi:hypothetical protein
MAVWLGLAFLVLAPPVMAQDAAPSPEPPPSAQTAPVQPMPPELAPAELAPARPAHKPGLFEAIGRWVDQGVTDFRGHMRGAKQQMDDLNSEAAASSKDFSSKAATAGKNAADAMTKLPTARMIDGRERCAIAPNGAPDCLTAAEALCRKHGYASGKSMDFTSAEECPVKTLLGQQSRQECKTVTFISRAMCQ